MLHQEIWMFARLFIALFLLGVLVAVAAFGILRQRRRDREAGMRTHATTDAAGSPSALADTAGARRAEQPRAWIDRAPTQPQPRRAA